MSSSTSYRLSGIALIVGSVLSVIYYVSQAFINGNDLTQLAGPLSVYGSLIGFIGSLLVLLGLPGMYVRQAQRAGILGLLGFLFVSYIIVLQGVIVPFTSVTIVPTLVNHPATRSLLNDQSAFSFGPFFLVSTVAQTVGILLLAIATLRAKVFPRWIGWLFIATLVLGVVSFLPFVPNFLGNLAPVLGSVAIAGVGYALLSPERLEHMQPATASTAAAANA